MVSCWKNVDYSWKIKWGLNIPRTCFNLTCTSVCIPLPKPICSTFCVTWKITRRACGSAMYFSCYGWPDTSFLFLVALSHHLWVRQEKLHFSHFTEMLITYPILHNKHPQDLTLRLIPESSLFSLFTLRLYFMSFFSDYSTLASFQKHECKTW